MTTDNALKIPVSIPFDKGNRYKEDGLGAYLKEVRAMRLVLALDRFLAVHGSRSVPRPQAHSDGTFYGDLPNAKPWAAKS